MKDFKSATPVRAGERGAALVTVMLVSLLMLSAGSALLLSTSMSAANTVDSTAEAQAYYAAEAGIQGALTALRGNIAPSAPLAGGALIDFRLALTPSDSNAPGDPATAAGVARLSRWLPYSSRTTADTRVSLNSSAPNTCNPGCYSITISEPGTTVTPAGIEPPRLVITSTGFGPKGARKVLRALVSNYRVILDPPATIVAAGGNTINFSLGSSNSSVLSGNGARPAVAVSPANVTTAQGVVTALNEQGGGTQITPADVGSLGMSVPEPWWLASPDAARAFLAELRAAAYDQNRVFTSKPADMGTLTSPKMTFIDNYNGGTLSLGAGFQGSGLLVVTGNIETTGSTSFDGVILVLGRGVLTRSGGGDGVMTGSLIIASFDPNDPNADTFGTPTLTVDGGGSLTMQFDPASIGRATRSTGRGVHGVVEN